jgi:hypothetical protein
MGCVATISAKLRPSCRPVPASPGRERRSQGLLARGEAPEGLRSAAAGVGPAVRGVSRARALVCGERRARSRAADGRDGRRWRAAALSRRHSRNPMQRRWHVRERRRQQLPQLAAWLETELVRQNDSRVPVALERLCLAIRPVEGEHQLSPQSLPLPRRARTPRLVPVGSVGGARHRRGRLTSCRAFVYS